MVSITLKRCVLCGDFNRFVNNINVCKACQEKVLKEAIDLKINVDDYIDGLIVSKELTENRRYKIDKIYMDDETKIK